MGNLKQSFIAGLFSIITIGILTLLTYKTEFGIFLIASLDHQWFCCMDIPKAPLPNPKMFFLGI